MHTTALRRTGGALTLAALIAIGVVIAAMAGRLREHADNTPRVRWAYQQVADDEFTAFGVEGRIEADNGHVVVRWGDDTLRLPIFGRDVPAITGMARFSGWLGIMAMASIEHGDHRELTDNLLSGEADPRLILVARSAPPDLDPATWGAAQYNDWIYRFYELTPDGRVVPDDGVHVFNYRGEQRVEEGFRSYRSLKNEPYSWRFVAAMQVTPGLHTPSSRNASPLSYPNYAGVRETLAAAGWTWPAAGAAFVALIVGLLMLGMSYARRGFDKA